jgi:hypothetical protein
MANFSLTINRNEDTISQNVTGRVQAAALYVIDTAANGNNWLRLTTATDLDTAETTAKAAALTVSVRITIDGIEYQRYGRPVLS